MDASRDNDWVDAGSDERGVSLFEMVVALSLFALIGLAGLSLMSSIIGVRERTDGRLERLDAVQSALDRLRQDVFLAKASELVAEGANLRLELPASDRGPAATIGYILSEGKLVREIEGRDASPILSNVIGATFETWPAVSALAPDAAPRALDVQLDLAPEAVGLSGQVRITIDLAAPP